MNSDQVRIYIDKTLSRCDDCPFIEWDGDFGLYVCRREDLWDSHGPIKIDQENFVIPHNCPFRKENQK